MSIFIQIIDCIDCGLFHSYHVWFTFLVVCNSKKTYGIMFRVSVCEDVKHLVHTFSISSQCKGRLRRNSGQRTTGPRLTCECILVEVGGRLGVSTGHFVMSIWPELHHRIVRLQRNLGQRTVGPRLICEWILVEIGGRLGVNIMGHFVTKISIC